MSEGPGNAGVDRFMDSSNRLARNGLRARLTGGVRAAVLAVLTLALAAPATAVDPFYLRLLRDGSDAFNRQDFAHAVTLLRRAVFGMLEEPLLLADGLTRLGLAQAAAGDEDGFRDTFRRLMEVEDRFQAYSEGEISPEVRRELERYATRLVPMATLAQIDSFAHLVPRPEDKVAELPPRTRRRELERLIRAEPGAVLWPTMLAELELEEGRHRQAASQAEEALQVDPENPRALRVRGLAQAARRRWPEAVDALERSGLAQQDAGVAASLLRGLLETDRAAEAVELFGGLPSELAEQEALARLGAQAASLSRQAREEPEPDRPGQESDPADEPVGTAETLQPVVDSGDDQRTGRLEDVSPETRRDLRQAHTLAAQNRLEEAFVLARRVADHNPELVEAQHLAGELAYRLSLWPEAVSYFRRGGDPGERHAVLRFYYAVALYQSGELPEARSMLESALPDLRRNEFVDQMVSRILGETR